MDKLAYLGGKPVIDKPFKSYKWNTWRDGWGVSKIITKGQLSGFLAQPNNSHYGGNWVKVLEELWAKTTSKDHAISFNSWTSGLEASIAALSLEPGSEVIVPSWTMSATIAAIIKNSLKPVFIDISRETFNLDVEKLDEVYSRRTQAVLAVDIFGKPCDADKIRRFCDQNKIAFVVDGAQTPLAQNKTGQKSAEIADICGFSFNRHKHIQTGEGGMAVTSKRDLAEKMRLYRNHFEVTKGIHGDKYSDFLTVGNNYRLGEMEAFLATKQTLRIDTLVGDRRKFARKLIKELRKFEYLKIQAPREWESHDYYIIGMVYDYKLTRVSRDKYVSALKAEGLKNIVSNYSNLHNIDAFKQFARGDMRNTDNLNDDEFIGVYICGSRLSNLELVKTMKVFNKVHRNLLLLRQA